MASQLVLEQGIEFLCATFDKRLDDLRKKIYYNLLSDLPDDLFTAACKHVGGTNTFFPVPGEIRAAAARLGKLANCVPTADEAWAELVNRAHAPRQVVEICAECARLERENSRLTELIKTAAWNRDHAQHDLLLGELNQVMRQQHARRLCPACQKLTIEYQFSHPLVLEVATRLGWPDRFWSENIGVDRGRFIKTYEAILEHRTNEAVLLPVVRDYIDERRSAFDTGEHAKINAQYTALARSLNA